MKPILFALAIIAFPFGVASQTITTPTQTDEIINENGQSSKADPGDRIFLFSAADKYTGGIPLVSYRRHIIFSRCVLPGRSPCTFDFPGKSKSADFQAWN